MRILLHIVIFLTAVNCMAQQENLSSQFAFNRILFNPAFSGFEKNTQLFSVYRTQWVGLQGAPQTQLLGLSYGKNNSPHGLGFILRRDASGIQDRIEAIGSYGFELKFHKRSIYLATSFRGRRYRLDFTRPELFAPDGFIPDPLIERELITSSRYNVGLGILYSQKTFFLGLAIPAIVKNGIRTGDNNIRSEEERHIFAMAGGKLSLGKAWDYSPSALFKIAKHTPFNLDLLNMFCYKESIHLGVNIRSGGSNTSMFESLNMLFGLQLTEKLFGCISYDYSLSELQSVSAGSFEVSVRYILDPSSLADSPKEPSILPISTPVPMNSDMRASQDSPAIQNPDDQRAESLLRGDTIIFNDIRYTGEKQILDQNYIEDLAWLVDFLKENTGLNIRLTSYSDARGEIESNKIKTNKRARSIAEYLINSGIDAKRILSIGMGESNIRNDCRDGIDCSEEEHWYNNRTEVWLIIKK